MTWNGERFRRWAAKIGSQTSAVAECLLGGHKVEQQGYKSCLALLKLADKYTPVRLEAACARALFHTSSPSCKGIAAILRSGQDRLENEETQAAASSAEDFGFTRGADYYRKGGEKC